MHAIYASSKSYSIYARNVFTVNLACIYGVRFRGHTIKHAYMHATHAPARGFSDKNFRLCPSTDGRPYLLGFEKFLTCMTGRGGKETG